jgi:histidyl-tRNA synthetase
MSNKLQTLKGFRDFLPEEKRRRDFVMEKIKQTFETFGFEPLETPTLEYASLLLGKYGQEADKLIFSFSDRGGRQVALKYDQTVPAARVLAQYQQQLPRYFRRYQIQNVFRAEKPQKGRYREFTQCDIDIFGAKETSAIADAEILGCTYAVYQNIGFDKIIIKLNDRQNLFKILKPFSLKTTNSALSLIQSIDKLDKLGSKTVIQELINKGLNSETAQALLTALKKAQPSPKLTKIINLAQQLGVPSSAIKFAPQLARGLDYYTGMIFEVIIPDYSQNSCAGGGRYDNLLNQLAAIDLPAVGMAIGFDRTVSAAEQLGLIPENLSSTQVLVTVFDQNTKEAALAAAASLRQSGIKTAVYPEIDKLTNQVKLANKNKIPFVITIGPDEIKQNKITLKDMKTGQQQTLPLKQVIKKLQSA